MSARCSAIIAHLSRSSRIISSNAEASVSSSHSLDRPPFTASLTSSASKAARLPASATTSRDFCKYMYAYPPCVRADIRDSGTGKAVRPVAEGGGGRQKAGSRVKKRRRLIYFRGRLLARGPRLGNDKSRWSRRDPGR